MPYRVARELLLASFSTASSLQTVVPFRQNSGARAHSGSQYSRVVRVLVPVPVRYRYILAIIDTY